ncbi:hypothetical protein QBE52_04510 [Clostridiaceae bacterium 35-E11]
MNLKHQLNIHLKDIQQAIADYEVILEKPEVQSSLDMKHFVKNKLQYYTKRKQEYMQCLAMLEYIEETVGAEGLREILEG